MSRWVQNFRVGLLACLATLFPLGCLYGEVAEETLQPLFIKAKEAYDQEQFSQAVALYEEILRTGNYAPAVFYNLGNAHFRQAQYGAAILNYERARQLAPLDTSIAANIDFAQKQAGALIPSQAPPEKVLRLLPTHQWLSILIATYWILGLVLAGYFLIGRPPLLKKLLPTIFTVLILASVGYAGNRMVTSQDSAVVMQNDIDALFAPLADSKKHFKLPAGSVVRILETSGEWIQVKSGKEKGWIQKKSCERVYPW